MTEKDLNNKLSILGYSRDWLDYGILTVSYLSKQIELFEIGDDANTEHYRYKAFINYLNFKSVLSDLELDNYLKLAINEPDPSMGGSAVVDLFKKANLTEHQFNKLCNQITHFGKWTEKIIERETLRRKDKSN